MASFACAEREAPVGVEFVAVNFSLKIAVF